MYYVLRNGCTVSMYHILPAMDSYRAVPSSVSSIVFDSLAMKNPAIELFSQIPESIVALKCAYKRKNTPYSDCIHAVLVSPNFWHCHSTLHYFKKMFCFTGYIKV